MPRIKAEPQGTFKLDPELQHGTGVHIENVFQNDPRTDPGAPIQDTGPCRQASFKPDPGLPAVSPFIVTRVEDYMPRPDDFGKIANLIKTQSGYFQDPRVETGR